MDTTAIGTLRRHHRRLSELRRNARALRNDDDATANASNAVGLLKLERDLCGDLFKVEAAITSAEHRVEGLLMSHLASIATGSMKVAQDTDAELRRVDAESTDKAAAMEDVLAQQPREVKRQLVRLLSRDLQDA